MSSRFIKLTKSQKLKKFQQIKNNKKESHNPSSYDEKNNKKQQYTQIKFVPSSTNPTKTTTTTIKFQQQQINVEKHTVIKQVNKNSPPQPQIQILKNPNKQVNESAKFQTITQLNQSKSVKVITSSLTKEFFFYLNLFHCLTRLPNRPRRQLPTPTAR